MCVDWVFAVFCCKQSSTQSSPPNVPGGGVPGQDSYQFGAGGYGVVGGAPSSASFGQPPPGQQGTLQFRIDLRIAPVFKYMLWSIFCCFYFKSRFVNVIVWKQINFLLCTPTRFFLIEILLVHVWPRWRFHFTDQKKKKRERERTNQYLNFQLIFHFV